jgi:hypothetical protein
MAFFCTADLLPTDFGAADFLAGDFPAPVRFAVVLRATTLRAAALPAVACLPATAFFAAACLLAGDFTADNFLAAGRALAALAPTFFTRPLAPFAAVFLATAILFTDRGVAAFFPAALRVTDLPLPLAVETFFASGFLTGVCFTANFFAGALRVVAMRSFSCAGE